MQPKLLFLITSLLLVHIAFSKPPKLEYGLRFYGNYSNNIISADAESGAIAEIYRDLEVGKFCVGANFFARKSFTKKLALSVGVGYLNVGEQTETFSNNFTLPSEIDPFYGFVQPTDPQKTVETKFMYNHHFLEIPIQLNYTFSQHYYVQAGPSFMLALAHNITQWKKNEGENATRETRKDDETDFKLANLGANLGIGRTFFDEKAVQFFVGLNAQYLFFNVAKDASINRKYYSAGIVAGITF